MRPMSLESIYLVVKGQHSELAMTGILQRYLSHVLGTERSLKLEARSLAEAQR